MRGRAARGRAFSGLVCARLGAGRGSDRAPRAGGLSADWLGAARVAGRPGARRIGWLHPGYRIRAPDMTRCGRIGPRSRGRGRICEGPAGEALAFLLVPAVRAVVATTPQAEVEGVPECLADGQGGRISGCTRRFRRPTPEAAEHASGRGRLLRGSGLREAGATPLAEGLEDVVGHGAAAGLPQAGSGQVEVSSRPE